ncbi:flavodoxin family protein [Nocardia aurantia]|uniref:Flavodoxin FldP n=1 Tax=Nocardia aurantia TaxID=2585199 RepID=A0A7K0DLR9_9NOCA|nr:flavodoxin family protein [Nocardia aurantia]MQY26696.1 Flavodoxin FldP [Nocardia aurantia]
MGQLSARVAVAYHTGKGHTGSLAEAVAEGAGDIPGTGVDLVPVGQMDDRNWDVLDAADAIVFGSPTYMGGSSATFREFAESTSGIFADNMRWRDKIAAGFTVGGSMSGDKLQTLTQMAIFAAQHGMIWVGLDVYCGWNSSAGGPEQVNRIGSWLGVMAQANVDQGPDTAPPASDLRTGALLGRRVADLAHLHAHGRAGYVAGRVPVNSGM